MAMAMAMAMTLKYILNVAQGRPESCHETIYINLRTYKICNYTKPQVYGMQEKLIFSPSARKANFRSPQHTYDR